MDHQAISERVIYQNQRFCQDAPNAIGAMLHFHLTDCDTENGIYFFSGGTEEWMCNIFGTLHGGIGATLADQAMGTVACAINPGESWVATIQMQTVYHRPLVPGQDVSVSVRLLSATRTLINLSCEVYAADTPDKLCISSSATYMHKPKVYEKNF